MSSLKRALLTLAAMALTAGYIWQANRVVAPKTATWQDVMAEARQGGYQLITTGDLASEYKIKSDSILLVDTRQEWEYRTGHIQKAVNLPMESTWLSRWRNKGALKKLLGPNKNRIIVFY